MSRKMSKALVIDASVAQSAGEAEHPVSSACRQALTTVLKVCHKVVMNKAIEKEWKKHQSGFSGKWIAAMQSRGKIVRIVPPDSGLSDKLERLNVGHKGIKAMLKDVHLVEAALQTDSRILSGDEAAKGLYHAASQQIDELKQIIWANPVDAGCVKWLTAGAKKLK